MQGVKIDTPDYPDSTRRQVAVELFLLGLSVIAVINTIFSVLPILSRDNDMVLLIMNFIIAVIFLIDFLNRFFRSPSKGHYFIKESGWADLLSVIPYPPFPLFRLVHSVRSVRGLQKIGGRAALHDLGLNRAGGALYLAIFLAVILVEVASLSIVSIEAPNPEANIKTASDAVWWAYVTITTIGYGDRYPVTNGGRIVGAILMTVGVGLFSVLTGFLANAFLGRPREKSRAQAVRQTTESVANELDDSLSEIGNLQKLLQEQQETLGHLQQQLQKLEEKAKTQDDQ
ncbi:MAG: ion transporter [Chloroflexota bacterium]